MTAKRSASSIAIAFAASLMIGVSFAPAANASTGNGVCSSTEFCVFEDYGQDKSKGFYDLGSPPDENFHGKSWYNGSGNIGDDISGWIAGSSTSCTGYKVFVNVDFRGASLQIAKGTRGDFSGAFNGPFNNVISSYSKYGC
ncbi:hypothetical protein OIE43_16890 [Streptomyces pseudovenezuelae]|uniref:hypothetical protein n=1 Tax=Streptomyces pseudovenezuelae TaxID=67350 RepID=UPI002E36A333|nr:hypothetical protein [Streptomyces pseudovenezuelae]